MGTIEPRLLARIEERRTRHADYSLTLADVESHALQVTIPHVDRMLAPYLDVGERNAERQMKMMDEAATELSQKSQDCLREISKRLDALGAKAEPLPLANAVMASLTPAQLDEMAALDEVDVIRWEVEEDVTAMNESVRVIEAFETWRELHVDGQGVRVAVLDSGIDATHPALPNVVDQVSTTLSEGVNVPGSHGTHVAGTIASQDPVYRGVAPGAHLINIKVLTASGSGQPQWVIRGLEEAVRRGARVANLSLGWSENFHHWTCNDGDCILCRAADNAVRLGVTLVVAAGNEDSAAGPGQFNVRHPGAAREAITVAAVDKGKELASFSSRGPGSARLSPSSPIRVTKPDVAGPGVGIKSTGLGHGFVTMSGTSMASPHVAGVAALYVQQHPEALPATVKKVLEHTCEPLPADVLEVGYGLVNAYAAASHR